MGNFNVNADQDVALADARDYLPPREWGAYTGFQADHPGVVWSEWVHFSRSSNVAFARYKLDGSGQWQVGFGGKTAEQRKLKTWKPGLSKESLYLYGPDPRLSDARFWEWVNQYQGGGSAGIWLDPNVKRAGVAFLQIG